MTGGQPEHGGGFNGSDREKLIRVDERTISMQHRMDNFEKTYVTLGRFRPVEIVVYALVAMMGGAVVAALLTLVIGGRAS